MTSLFRVATAAVFLVLVAGGPIRAQQAPAAPTDATPAAPAAPLPSLPQPQPDEEQIPLVVTRTRPEFAKELTGVLAGLQPEFAKKSDEMIDIAAKIYARGMSEDELKTTAAFFNSPAGKKYVDAQPLMLDQLVVAMQAWTQETSSYLMKRVQVEMEKRGDKF